MRVPPDSGQSTVEYMLVSLLTLGAVAAFWAWVKFVSEGEIMRHIMANASHTLSIENAIGFIGDLLVF